MKERCPFLPDEFVDTTEHATAQLPMKIAQFVFDRIAGLVSYLKLRKEDVLKVAGDIDFKISGVYFIVKNDEIIYVGQAKNIYSRLSSHHIYKLGEGLKIAFLPIDTDNYSLDLIESYYIHKFTPQKTRGAPYVSTNGKLQNKLLKEIQSLTNVSIWEKRDLFSSIGVKIPEELDINGS